MSRVVAFAMKDNEYKLQANWIADQKSAIRNIVSIIAAEEV